MENINEYKENNGSIKISDEVIATIASIAVSEIEGVCGLYGSFAGEIASKLSKKNFNKGVKITSTENDTIIDISLIVKYGIRIPEVAWEVQENVKKSVESMSGLNVEKVNIHIAGVEFEKNEPTQPIDETQTEE